MREQYEKLLTVLKRRSFIAKEGSETTKHPMVKHRQSAAFNAYEDTILLVEYYLEEFAVAEKALTKINKDVQLQRTIDEGV